MDFHTSLGAFFVRDLPGQDMKSVKLDKEREYNLKGQQIEIRNYPKVGEPRIKL